MERMTVFLVLVLLCGLIHSNARGGDGFDVKQHLATVTRSILSIILTLCMMCIISYCEYR